MMRRPKLGQHFLADPSYRRRIVQALSLNEDDFVVEIGAGAGAMTPLLAERAREVLAVELDPSLAARLEETVRPIAHIEVLRADILSLDLRALCRRHRVSQCFVFGNLPYYITSPILRHLFKFAPCIRALGLVVQREVAERLTALPGTRAYGYLSVLVQLHARPRVALRVPAGAFAPAPKVQSSLVLFDLPAEQPLKPREQAKFLEFVKKCFAQKRKTLINNLAAAYTRPGVESALAALGLEPNVRAEELSLARLIEVFRKLRVGRRRRGVC